LQCCVLPVPRHLSDSYLRHVGRTSTIRPVLYFDPATVTPVTGKLKGVLGIMIYHCHHQVAVFRDCSE
jgi:hypothetical protein